MTRREPCSASSLGAGEALAGTATEASRWLLLEVDTAWARDVEETALPTPAGILADTFCGRVQLIRRPGRRGAAAVAFVAELREHGGTLAAAGAAGEPVDGPLLLVCCHGRRDPCCARLGTPVFDALRSHLPERAVWQSSHLGGHRFAANVLVLPDGVLLGRVGPEDAERVAHLAAAGRIPLDLYRGRTIHPPEVQAADAALREHLGLTAVGDVSLVSASGGRICLKTPEGVVDATVEAHAGPPRCESCGKDPVASTRYSVRW
jgi:(2Fe-2S) ferredoxin